MQTLFRYFTVCLALFLLALSIFAWTVLASAQSCHNPTYLTEKQATSGYSQVVLLHVRKSYCTASLIDSSILITAAHCVDYSSSTAAPDDYALIGTRKVPLLSWGAMPESYTYKLDVALVILAQDQPPPYLRIAQKYPAKSDTLAAVGFGCSMLCLANTRMNSGTGVKRVSFMNARELMYSQFASTAVRACPGDSGGPVINIRTGEIVALFSRLVLYELGDVTEIDFTLYADVVLWRQLMDASRVKVMTVESERGK